MDKNPEQSKGPQKQSGWQKNWNKVSRTLGLKPKEVISEDGSDRLYGSRDKRVKEQLKPRFENAQKGIDAFLSTPDAAAGFKGQTKEEFTHDYKRAGFKADVDKNRALLYYQMSKDNERLVTRVTSQGGHNSFWKNVLDFEAKLKGLQTRTYYRDTLRNPNFNGRPLQERYKLLAEASQLYTQDFQEISNGLNVQRKQLQKQQRRLENSNEESGLEEIKAQRREIEKQRKEIECSIGLSQRSLKLAVLIVNKWQKRSVIAPHVEESLQLLHENTMQQIDIIGKRWRGENFKVQDQPDDFENAKFLDQIRKAENADRQKSIIWKYYARQVKKSSSLQCDLKDLYMISPRTPKPGGIGLEKDILKEIDDIRENNTSHIENALISENKAKVVKGFRELDRTIENMSRIHEQFQQLLQTDKKALSDLNWIEEEKHQKHLREASRRTASDHSGGQSSDFPPHSKSASGQIR